MINNPTDICIEIAQLLHKRGISNVCISPGLRNAALSLSFIKHGKFNCYSIIDERSAGYFALGIALKTNIPSILICTSGTAVANYFPAIIESSQSRIPLIIISADRPIDLLNTGENQTINQKDIYGDFVRRSLDINNYNNALNDIEDSLKFVIDSNDKCVPGPIHFNIHLDDFKNFKPQKKKNKFLRNIISNKRLNSFSEFNWGKIPYEDIFNLYNYEKPIIVIGRLNYKLDEKLINQLSKHLKAPILADSLSQMRFDNELTLKLYDHYINSDDINPDLIIRIGQKPVSKNLCKKLDQWKDKTINRLSFSSLLIDESGRFNDDSPTVIESNYKEFIKFIIKYTKKNLNSNFYNHITELDKKAAAILIDEKEWSELMIAKASLSSINNDENFFIGNSMPIRYIDMIGNLGKNINIHTYSNRGASGIDGNIGTALGVSISSGKPTALLIGDLSFIHDQNSLLIAKQYNINLTIIIINNNGGGIFSLLPVSKSFNKNIFDKYWTTPQNLDFKTIANLYDAKYRKVSSNNQLASTLIKYNNIGGIKIIDAHIDIKKNKKILINLKKRIKKGVI